MTLNDFLGHLANTSDEMFSNCDGDGCSIRIYGFDSVYCPITAVAHMVTGEEYDIEHPNEAAMDINLPANLASEIVMAADGSPMADPAIRQGLLNALS